MKDWKPNTNNTKETEQSMQKIVWTGDQLFHERLDNFMKQAHSYSICGTKFVQQYYSSVYACFIEVSSRITKSKSDTLRERILNVRSSMQNIKLNNSSEEFLLYSIKNQIDDIFIDISTACHEANLILRPKDESIRRDLE
jgi:hypothetical protein